MSAVNEELNMKVYEKLFDGQEKFKEWLLTQPPEEILNHAYLRKMAIDGYVVKLELPELREMVSLLRRSSNNLNQIARRVNSTNRVYNEDIQEILRTQEKLWEIANTVLSSLASIN